jgi:hypothetical protein
MPPPDFFGLLQCKDDLSDVVEQLNLKCKSARERHPPCPFLYEILSMLDTLATAKSISPAEVRRFVGLGLGLGFFDDH